MASALALYSSRRSLRISEASCFLMFCHVLMISCGQEVIQMSGPVTADRDVDVAEEIKKSHILSFDKSPRRSYRRADSTYKDIYGRQPGPKECSVCDEMMPVPDLPSSLASHQDYDRPPNFNLQSSDNVPNCCKIHGIQADCTHCNLTAVPTALPKYITRLLLGHNYLTTDSLSQSPFKIYPRLRLLSLSTNQITYLPDDAFKGLPSLRCLCLQFNDIKMDGSLNSSMTFQPLAKSLAYLRLNGFNRNTTGVNLMYPSYALSFLSKLKYLFIDGIPLTRFENPGGQLTTLTHLVMAGYRYGYCNLTGLQNEAFEISTLTHLDISDCQLDGSHIDSSAFENLRRLQMLIISNNFQFGIQTVGELMYSFRNSTTLKVLIMDRISPRFSPCVVVYKHTLRYFQHTRLRQIFAMDNEIEIIEKGALQLLPKTLNVLNMTANKIIFGDYIQDLATLTELTNLVLEGSADPYHFPKKFPLDFLSNCMGGASGLVKFPKSKSESAPVMQQSSYMLIPLPPKLFKIYLFGNGMAYTLNNIAFSTPNNLISADLSRNIFNELYGPIKGLEKLAILEMDNCNMQYISYSFFKFFPSLQILSLYQNQLEKSLAVDKNGDTFSDLKNITVLNLSENNIWLLYPPVFKNMDRMQHIDLSQNRLGAVHFSIEHMKSLESLNLKGNQIQTLTPQTMAAVDKISQGRKPLRINLSFNPISCNCDNLKFLVWLTSAGVMEKKTSDYYLCDMIEQPHGYEKVIEKLRRECIQQHTLFAVVASATMVFMLAILILLAYRFRWTLRYWYHAAKLRFQPVISPENFEFDVFVSYSDKDDFVEEELIPKLQDEFHLRVMMHGLCFPAGGHITDSIHMAVTTSRKTLVVITKNMLKSHWCNYELMMARREAIRRGRQVLIFLFLEDLEHSEMTSNIASYIRESTYIAYPPDPRYRRVFWRKLAEDLGSDVPFT